MPKKAKSVARERTSSVAELAAFAGVHRTTVYEWAKIPGYPIASDGTVAKWDLCEWLIKRSIGPSAGAGAADDEMMIGPTGSPWLEKYREQRAGLAELELRQKRGELIEVADVQEFVMLLASLLRGGLDIIQRQCSPDVYTIVRNCIADVEGEIRRKFVDEVSDESQSA